ncbi:DNA phosphorothioation-dependent restriction protein DptH [Endozoicomonas sp. ALC020]|uniref:DNA phosphorothioation-dependent restriction protein DptH n=1 Tax=unclassified Endozoicomonas TaxID=2644528 RepID=UPI003BB06506
MSVARFEHFLFQRLSSWLQDRIRAGSRYQFQSPDADNTSRLFNELKANVTSSITFRGTPLPYIEMGGVRVICVAHAENRVQLQDGFNENYISTLRDEVAGQSGDFTGCALLIIHNSLLDTLINSADNLASEGMPWSTECIKNDLEALINDQPRPNKVLLCLLRWQTEILEEVGGSMFGFEQLFGAMTTGDEPDLTTMGLLPDAGIADMSSEKQIEKRLKENRKLHDEIDTVVHHFPEELDERLPDFGEKFIKEQFKGDVAESWKQTDVQVFWDEADVQRQQGLDFAALASEACELIGPRNKKETAAGKREKHLILVARPEANYFDLKLTFHGKDLEKGQVVISNNKQLKDIQSDILKLTGSSKRHVSMLAPFTGKPSYLTLKTNRPRTKECFTFHILVVRKGDFYLPAFENTFLVNPGKECLTLQTEDMSLLVNESQPDTLYLSDNEEEADLSIYGSVNYQKLYEESDEVNFSIRSGQHRLAFTIEGAVNQESLKLPLLMDEGRFNLLFNDDYFGQFIEAKSLVVIDNKEAKIIGRRLILLQREVLFLQLDLITQGGQGKKASELEYTAPEIYRAWRDLTQYLKIRKTLLSLASWGPTLTELVRNYVNTILDYLRAIRLGRNISDTDRMILKIGVAVFDGKEYFTPFHPLVLCYYLSLVDAIQADKAHRSFKNLPEVTRDRLNPKGLLPYIFSQSSSFSYTQVVSENSFWLEIVPQQETSHSYVSKLVKEKAEEFIKTFSELFRQVDDAPLIINSVNNSDNREIFLGLLSYFQTGLLNSRHIHVNLYDDALCETEFDRFAEMGAYDQIKQEYRLDKGKVREKADTIIDLLRSRLSFSKFTHDEKKSQSYAHLSFFKNNQKIQRVSSNIDEHISGVAADGLLNGESSISEHGSYLTAFGLNKINTEDKPQLEMARLYGRLLQPCKVLNEQYHERSSIGLAVSDEFKTLLERSYDSSIWTTIVDPKVTLEFFQNEQNLVLIHYSDQYTNSAGYDAITVTRQTDLYKQMLSQQGDELIGEFNAFNGEWLLKMVTGRPTEQKAKLGIIAAWKLISSMISSSDITWVPISVAEMVRVSGNIGLKMDKGDFARYHKSGKFSGNMSDDILFAGFKDGQLYLLPVEVKTGAHSSASLDKAQEQCEALQRYLVEGLFGPETLEGKIYRSLFIRQVLMQIEKYQLYNVFEKNYFDELLAAREQWLSGDYKLASLKGYPEGMVVAHLEGEGTYQTSAELRDNILQLIVPMGYLDMLVGTPLAQLQPKLVQENKLGINQQWFLGAGLAAVTYEPEAVEPEVDDEDEVVTFEQPPQPPEIAEEVAPVTEVLPPPEPVAVQNEALKVQFGSDSMSGQPVFWEPTNTEKVFNPNTAIIGTMGTGKTQFTKSLITQLIRNQDNNVDSKPLGILILDYKADYIKEDFIQATNAKTYDLENLPFNPLALFGTKPRLPVHTASLFRSTLTTAFGLGAKQQTKIRNVVMDAYKRAGIDPNSKDTWTKPAPTIQQVWDVFEEDEKVEQDKLYAVMDELISFQIFDPDPTHSQSLYDMVDGVTVINLSGYDPNIQNLVAGIILDIFYNQMHQQGSSKIDGKYRQLTKFVLVDEADNFMRQDFTSLRMLMKEGREFGVGTILSTQEMDHFRTSDNDFSSYINSWVIHKVAKLKKQDIQTIFNTQGKSDEERVMRQILQLEKHYSLYIGGSDKARKIKDLAFWEIKEK